ncbi:hypothetical protein M405DRAFT_934538 [Rhizopogon salebrosus TDB-379]|nr:hypothetical protein M405DRAFT_934538 [Rhizopogon salebrosus TDB-379]
MSFGTGTNVFGTNAGASIFGQSNASKPATSSFGNTQPSSGTGTTTGFGGFGVQPQAQAQQPAQGSALFGGGSFGQPQQQQPSVSTSLFSQPTQQQQQQQQQQQPTTSMFGQPTQQQPQSTLGTSLFGNPTTTTGQQAGGLFGGTQPQQPTNPFGAAQPQQQTMFGSTQPQQSSGGMFGSTTQQAAPAGGLGLNTAGPSLFGQQRQPSMMSTTPISGPAPFSKSTKFNDLPEDIKRTFEAIDSHIQGRIQISNELKQRKMGEEAIKGQGLIRGLHKELLGVSSVIQSDSLFSKDLKAKTEQAVQDTIVATNIIEGFKNPHQSAAYLKNHASFPLEFFTRVTQEMQERLQWYKNTIEQIERKLSASASQSQNTPQAISSTLQTQHAIFVSLAARTAAVDGEVQKVKELYTQLWRAKTGSMRDPFNDLDRGSGGEFGMESIQVK